MAYRLVRAAGRRLFCPVWHKISAAEVREHSPILADKLAVSSEVGIAGVVRKIIDVLDEQ